MKIERQDISTNLERLIYQKSRGYFFLTSRPINKLEEAIIIAVDRNEN